MLFVFSFDTHISELHLSQETARELRKENDELRKENWNIRADLQRNIAGLKSEMYNETRTIRHDLTNFAEVKSMHHGQIHGIFCRI